MKIIIDTNVLVRAVVRDDEKQARAAAKILKEAEIIAVSSACLCEFAWVLRKVYGFGPRDTAAAIGALINAANTIVNRAAVEAGLAMLDAGGDFADGLIAYEGRWFGGETFATFDRKAAALLTDQGQKTVLLA